MAAFIKVLIVDAKTQCTKCEKQNASRNLTCKRTFKLLFRLFHEVAVPFGLIIIQRIHFQTAAVFGTALSSLPATASRIGPYQPTSAQAMNPYSEQLTSLLISATFDNVNIIYLFTKQATLRRRPGCPSS